MRGIKTMLGLVVGGWLGAACGQAPGPPARMDVEANMELKAHSAEFRQEIIEVTDGVHVAVGFGLANAIMIEGDGGRIIVDTLESAEAAAPVKAAFDAISSAPVQAIVYTHNHADHVFGAGVFAGADAPSVISHASTLVYLDRILNIIRPAIYKRSMRQFGTLLPEGGIINCGIGPRLVYDNEKTPALVRPNETFDGERLDTEIAGVRLELVHAPGETPDQIFVWLPDKRALLPGDNFYKSFPNLYAIRGTAYRDVMDWVRSLDKMRALGAEFLVPSHSRPMTGAAAIATALTDYRDSIQYVHDQTVRHMNMGETPERIVEQVRLPAHLATKPYLREYYGRVDWSVRSIFTGYLGWFGGNATDLDPLPKAQRAARIAELAGGTDPLLLQAREALDEGDYQWALELADLFLSLVPREGEARVIRSEALRALGERQLSANARNYYLTQAIEADGDLVIEDADPADTPTSLLQGFPVENFIRAMPVNLDPEKSADVDVVVGFRFPDVNEAFTVHVRHGVAEVQARWPEKPGIAVTVDSNAWKEIMAGKRNAAVALAAGDVRVEGGTIDLVRFLALFR